MTFTTTTLLNVALLIVPSQPTDEAVAPLVNETFEKTELGEKWKANTGDWKIVDGVLRAKEIPEQKHSAAARRIIVTKDAEYELRFRFVKQGKAFHFGFDPAKGELDKKGHLFSIIVTPGTWKIMKHIDKNRRQEDPNEVLAQSRLKFETDQWHTLKVTTNGTKVLAVIDGQHKLKADHPTFSVRKPTLVFRCLGDGVEVDDIKVRKLPTKAKNAGK